MATTSYPPDFNIENIKTSPTELSSLNEASLELDRAAQRLIRAGWPEAWLGINLPLGATRALLVLEAGRANNPRTLADVLGVGRTTVTGLIDRLEDEGLITRSIDPTDKRSFALHLTDKGRNLVRQIEDIRRQQLARALNQMDKSALDALHTGLAGLVEAMQAEQIRDTP